MKFIVNDKTYAGMPFAYKEDGSIRWIVTGKSPQGQAREEWWDKRRAELNITKAAGWKAAVARTIHPLGEKPCQICGKIMKLQYLYPNKTCTYKKNVNQECDEKDCCSRLGPGAMSDCPDRFDGFHTYNRCCRSKEDTGRHKENLARYGEDRRAYTFWAEGDWKAASWLMQVFKKHNRSADHIGPLSLGFCHRPKFEPMTKSENSAKGNRLTYENVITLLKDEKNGEQVISSHSRSLWDKLKVRIKNDADAKKASSLLRKNMHTILTIFSILAEKNHVDFLIKYFLHPEHALYQHAFKNFDPKTGSFEIIETKKAIRTEHTRNAERYIKKSLEALEDYREVSNRNVLFNITPTINNDLQKLLEILETKNYVSAYTQIQRIFESIAQEYIKEY